ncbi:MAG: DUF4097 family beta strand repeat-containing protein [Chitinophagales bacterium]|nr:DUF4097 family beta strand repeat-containing protein [Chitinophagales bacterium]
MRIISTIIGVLMVCCQLNAQTPPDQPKDDFAMSLDEIDWVIIESGQTILVESNNKNKLVIPGYNEIEEDVKLQPNSSNEDQGYFVFKQGKNLVIRDLRKQGTSTTLSLPKHQNIKVTGLGLHNIYLTNFSGAIEANTPRSGNITLTNCSGPSVLNSYTGNIRMYFERVELKSSVSAISSSGNITIVLPKDTKASVDLETGTRDIASDFEIFGRSIETVGKKIRGEINGGGTKIMLATTFGTINLKASEH